MRRNGETKWVKTASKLPAVAIATLALCGAVQAQADVLPAGALVRNIASARFDIDGDQATIPSNLVATRIDELLDLLLAPKSEGVFSVPTQLPPGFGVPFILTNSGNGTEAFQLSAAVPGEAASLSVAIDVDGNGAYDPAVDIDIPSNGATPPVAPGGRLNLLVRFANAPANDGVIELLARAATGAGTAGLRVAGMGDGGSDAIVGHTDALASATLSYTLQTVDRLAEPATLTKSQTVQAPDGSAAAMIGATITYRLELATQGAETLEHAEIVDAIPAGTAYVPGSIRLNGAAASDARDGDAGQFDGSQIRVALGDLAQPTTQVVTFQVIIQ